jgi:hypothetical protein
MKMLIGDRDVMAKGAVVVRLGTPRRAHSSNKMHAFKVNPLAATQLQRSSNGV